MHWMQVSERSILGIAAAKLGLPAKCFEPAENSPTVVGAVHKFD